MTPSSPSPRRPAPGRAGRGAGAPRRALVLAATVLTVLACAAPAMASHEKGGFLSTNVSASGHLQGTLVYMTRGTCTVGASGGSFPVAVTEPDATPQTVTVQLTDVQCLPNLIVMRGTFDVDLSTWGGQQVGDYVTSFSSCCRVAGIINVTSTSTYFESKVRSVVGTATAAPRIESNVATGIGVGYEYRQNLNASDPDGGTVSYLSQAGQPNGPDTDIVSFQPNGDVVIPAATTATMANGDNYVYKVRVVDTQGDYSERDVLLTATTSNHPPVIGGLPAPGDDVVVAPGTTRTIQLSATDPDAADAVTLDASSLPPYITFSQTPGNPASATLTIAPPAGTPTQAVGINLDAVDDNAAPLTASANLQVKIATPPITKLDGAPSAQTDDATPSFAFSATPAGSTFECRIDGGAWAACTSPYAAPALADGPHIFDVRATSQGIADPQPAHADFTVDTAAPARPAILTGPPSTGSPSTATLTFNGEPGGSFECRIDGGTWAPCAGTVTYTALKAGRHVVEVRQVDAAGNAGEPVADAFVVGPAAPAAPTAVQTSVAAHATVQGRTVRVGCAVDHGSLRSCAVQAYAVIRTSSGRQQRVLVGTGSVTARAPGQQRQAVAITLNARGRALVAQQAGGLHVELRTTARAYGAPRAFHGRATSRLLPARQLIFPADGLFAVDSANLLPAGARYVTALAPQLRAAKQITCTGYTDATGTSTYNKALGLARAATVCHALVAAGHLHGVRLVIRSAGESRPRASNATAQGRALNRRVALDIRYR